MIVLAWLKTRAAHLQLALVIFSIYLTFLNHRFLLSYLPHLFNIAFLALLHLYYETAHVVKSFLRWFTQRYFFSFLLSLVVFLDSFFHFLFFLLFLPYTCLVSSRITWCYACFTFRLFENIKRRKTALIDWWLFYFGGRIRKVQDLLRY